MCVGERERKKESGREKERRRGRERERETTHPLSNLLKSLWKTKLMQDSIDVSDWLS